jgi:predicted phage terminase large subunit-like protein
MAWAAEYQGVPRPVEGNRLKRAWFEIVDAIPAAGMMVRYWDKAGTAGGGAFTAGVKMLAADGRFYILDVIRGQWSAGEREAVMRQTATTDGRQVSVVIEQEPGSGGKESAEATIRNLAGFAVYADRVTGSKDTRLEPFAAQAEAGNVKLLVGEWNRDYIDELCAVPGGQYRDQVDATAGAFIRLTEGATSLGYVSVGYGR